MQGSLYVIDALNYVFRAFHALPPLRNSRGLSTGALYGLSSMIEKIERDRRPTHLAVVLDAPGRTFRDDLYSEYKAHRPSMPPELAEQVALLPRVISGLGLPLVSVDGFEADDVIATIARQGAKAGLQVVVCSSDKDLMQLCCDGITLLDGMRDRVIGPSQVEEKFGVPPSLVGDVLALIGDSIDNVPGVPGIGPKTAAELIKKYGSLDELLLKADQVKGKRGEALVASRELVRLSRKLVALCEDVPLPFELTSLARPAFDREARIALFRELEFKRLLESELAAAGRGETGPGAALASSRPSESGTTAAVPADPIPVPPAVDADIVGDEAALVGLAQRLAAAGRFGFGYLLDEVDPMRAGLVGLAFALPDGARLYVPLGHSLLDGPRTMTQASVLAVLGPVLSDGRIAKHVHDGKRIEVWLGQNGVAMAGLRDDVLLAAYLLDPSRSRYDLELVAAAEGLAGVAPRAAWLGTGRTTRRAAEVPAQEAGARLAAEAVAALQLAPVQRAKLETARMVGIYDELEVPLSHVLADVEREGIRLDVPYLRELGQEVGQLIASAEEEIYRMAGAPFNIASPKQLQDVLFGKLGLPVIRKTKTGASTDADVLEELAPLHPVPAKILDHRQLMKLKGTYIEALPALVNVRTGRLHTTFHQAVAATGRLSSSDPNLQNIPIRTELGRRIRRAFVADPGNQIVSADYSQIELRILAHFSEDPAFLDAFRSNADIHQRTAAEVFGIPPDSVSSEQRRIAKAINFGLVFGQTDFGLAQVLRIPRMEARAYIDAYFKRYAGVRGYMERAIVDARDTGEVGTLLGRRRPLPEIRASRQQDRAYAERIARNSPIQGSAADLLKVAMIRVHAGLQQHPGARLLLTVHDELVFEVPDAGVQAFTTWVKQTMEGVHELRVPLVADVGTGPNWGQAH